MLCTRYAFSLLYRAKMAKLLLVCFVVATAVVCINATKGSGSGNKENKGGGGSRPGSSSGDKDKSNVPTLTKLCADEVAKQMVHEFAEKYQAAVKGILYPGDRAKAKDRVDEEVKKILKEHYNIPLGAIPDLVNSIRTQAEKQKNPKKRPHVQDPIDPKTLGMVPRCLKKPKTKP
ncbi:uncharacterized protein LOC129584440 [Paramacrobiotus metropolitanus]|uniref:uncharacterized protein LOC129584440 n=1 Tax=Paramacrobiotus metropolitanus TaxID=2943436 RepID=UPI002445B1D1|nr:uncharacterized protein LOC129584440 [Paramacrobiotus metropolitanus]